MFIPQDCPICKKFITNAIHFERHMKKHNDNEDNPVGRPGNNLLDEAQKPATLRPPHS